MRDVVLPQDIQVAVWQWPDHRVLWGIQLQKGQLISVVAEEDDGAMTCALRGDHYFVLWPDGEGKLKANASTTTR